MQEGRVYERLEALERTTLATHAEPEHRYWFPAGTLYSPKGRWTTKSPVVMNLSRPDLAQVRVNEPVSL